MFKDSSYREKFQELHRWFPLMIGEIKKDLKNHHLKTDKNFFRKYFSGKLIQKITLEELISAYTDALGQENGENLGEFLSNRWLLQNSDLYYHFEKKFQEMAIDFEKIEQLEKNPAETMMQSSIEEFGAIKTYIFSVLNGVVFPKETFEKLAKLAKEENVYKEKLQIEKTEKTTIEELKKEHERELIRLTDRYEKKISGLQRKYQMDVDGLKKQISQLQRKINV